MLQQTNISRTPHPARLESQTWGILNIVNVPQQQTLTLLLPFMAEVFHLWLFGLVL